jgi:putative peptide maturation system protein
MNTTDKLVLDALAFLRDLAERGVEPDAAMQELGVVRAGHPEAKLDLLWEREPYRGTVHYDLLVSHDGRNSVWLGWCPDRGIPWVLRGVHRHSEADLVRVNGETLRVDTAMQLIDYIWKEERILAGLVDSCLIRQASVTLDVPPPSDAELQNAVDDFRRRHGLLGRDDTLAWLEQHGMSYEQLEFYVADAARVRGLRNAVVGAGIEAWFLQHREELRRVTMLLVSTGRRDDAEAIAREGRGSIDAFVRAAATHSTIADTRSERLAMVVEHACDLPTALADAVLAAAPGSVVGPILQDGRWRVAHVMEHHDAVLDDACARKIADRMFAQWLATRRAEAEVQWLWGREAAPTSRA